MGPSHRRIADGRPLYRLSYLKMKTVEMVPRAGVEPAQALRAGLSVVQEASPYWTTPPPGTRSSVAIYRFSIGG